MSQLYFVSGLFFSILNNACSLVFTAPRQIAAFQQISDLNEQTSLHGTGTCANTPKQDDDDYSKVKVVVRNNCELQE